MANTVLLEFAGDARKLTIASAQAVRATNDVSNAARSASNDLSKANSASSGFTKNIGQLAGSLSDFAAQIPGVIGGAVDALPPMGKPVAAALVAGLAAAAAPAIGAAVTTGVLLGVGGGVLALGIKSAAEDPRVKSAFETLGKQGKDVLKDFGKPFVDPLVRAAKTFSDTLDNSKPSIERIGAIIAPVIDKLAPAFSEFIENVMPGLEEAVAASVPLFDVLAEKLPVIGDAVSDFFSSIADNGESATLFFSDMLSLIGFVIGALGTAIGWLTSFYAMNRQVFLDFKSIASSVGVWFRDVFWGTWIKGAWSSILSAGKSTWNWLRELPGRLSGVFSSVGSRLASPFISAFNRIADAWNNTVGRLSWSVPGWVPGIGGNSISAPRLPRFHTGGIVPGVPGTEVPIMAMAGERVSRRGTDNGGTLGMANISVKIDGDVLIEAVGRLVRRRGGDTQFVLGGANA